MRPSRPGQAHGAEVLQRESVGKVFVGQVQELAALGGAGIVHDDVQASELAHRELDNLPAGIRRTQVRRDGFRRASGCADLGCGRVEQRLIARRQNHARARSRQFYCNRPPDTPARAGHDRNPAFQGLSHASC